MGLITIAKCVDVLTYRRNPVGGLGIWSVQAEIYRAQIQLLYR